MMELQAYEDEEGYGYFKEKRPTSLRSYSATLQTLILYLTRRAKDITEIEGIPPLPEGLSECALALTARPNNDTLQALLRELFAPFDPVAAQARDEHPLGFWLRMWVLKQCGTLRTADEINHALVHLRFFARLLCFAEIQANPERQEEILKMIKLK